MQGMAFALAVHGQRMEQPLQPLRQLEAVWCMSVCDSPEPYVPVRLLLVLQLVHPGWRLVRLHRVSECTSKQHSLDRPPPPMQQLVRCNSWCIQLQQLLRGLQCAITDVPPPHPGWSFALSWVSLPRAHRCNWRSCAHCGAPCQAVLLPFAESFA